MDNDEVEGYPEDRSASDVLQPLAKGTVGVVPFAGGLLGEVMGLVWQPALERRRDEWFRKLGESVIRLQQEHSEIRARLESEQVLTVTAQAAVSAISTHQEEKRTALRAAVLNSALAVEPDEERQLLFLRLIDSFSASHLQLLAFLHDPSAGFAERGIDRPQITAGAMSHLIEAVFTDWPKDFYPVIGRDLETSGLIHGLSGMMTAQGLWQGRTTELGQRFLRFVTEP
jgi:hypothetical protein